VTAALLLLIKVFYAGLVAWVATCLIYDATERLGQDQTTTKDGYGGWR
jgi:hypothetical protein